MTRKITRAAARIKLGLQNRFFLGNLDARRDWGHAKDFVKAQWMILQHSVPDDFVIATGEQHSVREFVEVAFGEIGVTVSWKGEGIDEKGFDESTGNILVEVDPRYFRPTEVENLLGDSSKAREKLGWKPTIGFHALVAEMVREDLKDADRDMLCKNGGYKVFSYHE